MEEEEKRGRKMRCWKRVEGKGRGRGEMEEEERWRRKRKDGGDVEMEEE